MTSSLATTFIPEVRQRAILRLLLSPPVSLQKYLMRWLTHWYVHMQTYAQAFVHHFQIHVPPFWYQFRINIVCMVLSNFSELFTKFDFYFDVQYDSHGF